MMLLWTRWIWPRKLVWVEWRWGTIRLYPLDKTFSNCVAIVNHFDEFTILHKEYVGHDGNIAVYKSERVTRWAYYRPWWKRKLPDVYDEDSEYKIKINERAKPQIDGRFHSPRTLP